MTQQASERVRSTYAWPPLPIEDAEEAATIMAERLQAAWDDLEAERLAVLLSLTMGRKALVDKTLREFQDGVTAIAGVVAENVERYLTLHLGPRYEAGAVMVSGQPMTWTQAHQLALTSLATDTYDDFLKRAHEAEQVSEAFVRAVREASATELPKIAAGGRTARQVADRLEERLLTSYGLASVTYADGSQVQVRTYTRMAARTKSAVAYNAGTLNESYAAGVRFVEIFDGKDCGLRWHDDPDKANGTIRHIEDAARYAISHPNCTRGFGPRPDITTREEAENAAPSTTAEQRADQGSMDYVAGEAPRRTRPAEMRRARATARRQARQLGATEPEQVGDIIARILADRGLT